VKIVANEMNRWLRVDGRGATITLAPFERRVVSDDTLAAFDEATLKAREEIVVEDRPEAEIDVSAVIAACVFPYFLAAGALAAFVGQWGWVLGLGIPLIGLVYIGVKLKWATPTEFGSSLVSALGWCGQQLALLAVLAVGGLMPAAALWWGADVKGVVDTIVDPPKGADLTPEVYTLVGRLLQFAFIATVSLVPALLFFLFDREQLQTLREQFVRQIFRLDSTVRTRRDAAARYGGLMKEAFGRERAGSRYLPGRRSPLLVATFVIALGWLLTLMNADVRILEEEPRELLSLFTPRHAPITYGFLGAYFFALNAILRGYVRKDLRPKSYSSITVRILTVAILAWVLEALFPDDAAYLLAFVFVAGIVPDTALVYLQEAIRRRSFMPNAWRPNDLVEQHPLTNLEGIDLYDRARLADEGVTNVEGLAYHNLIELMLYTRIPGSRLVDWIDQAILYLHVGDLGDDKQSAGEARRQALDILGAHGIRTATDLQRAWWAAHKSGEEAERALLNLLPPLGGDNRPARLRVVLDVVENEEWVEALRNWHRPMHRSLEPIVVTAPSAEPVPTPAPVEDEPAEPAPEAVAAALEGELALPSGG
jgi:hypothetical protein